jgi:hypothetical protein
VRLKKHDVVCGLPAADARKVMRLFGAPKPAYLLREWAKDVDSLAQTLEMEGWFQRHSVAKDGEVCWETTIRGNQVQASFCRPVRRATAERHLESVIERAEA